MFKIIGISGRKGSGKSELSSSLINDGFSKISFADWMKSKLSDFLDINLDYFYNQKYKDCTLSDLNLEPIIWDENLAKKFSSFIKEDININKHIKITSLRQLMQFIGTDLLREKDKLFHVKKTLSNLDNNKKYICDDLRFQNELSYLNSLGDNVNTFYLMRPFNWSNISNHESEIDLKWHNFSQIILNIYDNVADFINYNYNNMLNNKCQIDLNKDFNLMAFSNYSNVLTEHLIVAYLHKSKQMGHNFINNIIYFDKFNSFNWINTVKNNFYLSHSEIKNNMLYNFSKENIESLFILENLKIWNDSNFLIENLPFDIKNEYISELRAQSDSN